MMLFQIIKIYIKLEVYSKEQNSKGKQAESQAEFRQYANLIKIADIPIKI